LKDTENRRYAVILYDKYTGEGVRVYIDSDKIKEWRELNSRYFKLKPKKDQDSDLLYEQIRGAGHSVCGKQMIRVKSLIDYSRPRAFVICPECNEAYLRQTAGSAGVARVRPLTGN